MTSSISSNDSPSRPEAGIPLALLETPLSEIHRERLRRREAAESEQTRKNFEKLRKQQAAPGGLIHFVHHFWPVLEPATELVDGWPLEAICLHLEAVTFGDITRLLINVPPGFMKSLLVNVFWPAWEWGPMGLSHLRYVSFSYGAHLTRRDNSKMRDLVLSQRYRDLWGDRFDMVKVGEHKIENDKTGWKFASSEEGVGTGERGDRVLFDDPHNVIDLDSDDVMAATVDFFRTSMSNRLNDMKRSAIIVVMQRLKENDVSGDILAREAPYCHLMVPMEFDPGRYEVVDGEVVCDGNEIGWIDPRAMDAEGNLLSPTELEAAEGELAWPARFPPDVVSALELELGPYAYSGQYQQAPVPKKGGIFPLEYWQFYEVPESGPRKGKFPDMEFILVSVDTSFTEKEENDPNGCTVWGVFRQKAPAAEGQDDKAWDADEGLPKVMLLAAWRKHLSIHGPVQPPQKQGESAAAYTVRCMPHWGLVEWIAHTCRRFGGADMLLIEEKASGIDVVNEMKRLYGNETWGIEGIVPTRDKVSRALSVQPVFSQGLVYAPVRDWSDLVKDEMAVFPKGRYKDLTDSATQALKWMRVKGLIQRPEDIALLTQARMQYRKKAVVLYHA